MPANLTSPHPRFLPWIGNAYLSSKPLPRIFLKSDVRNVFAQKLDPANENEQRYAFVWNRVEE